MWVCSTISSTSASPPSCSASAQVCGLVEPHQRRLDRHRRVQAEAERDLQRLQRVVAAVGVAGVVGLAHAADQHVEAAPVGHRRREGEEQQVAARHEGVRQAAARSSRSRASSVSAVSEIWPSSDEVEQVVVAEPGLPTAGTSRAARRARGAGNRARRRGAGRSRSRWSRRARSAPAPRPGRRSSPGRRRTAPARGAVRRSAVRRRRLHPRISPWPSTTHFSDVSPSSPTGPRAWNLSVLMPISAPRPYSKPSAKRVLRVDHHAGRIDLAQEAHRVRVVVGQDRVGVVRAVAVDVRDRLVERVDDLDADDRREVFLGPVLLGGVGRASRSAPPASSASAAASQRISTPLAANTAPIRGRKRRRDRRDARAATRPRCTGCTSASSRCR